MNPFYGMARKQHEPCHACSQHATGSQGDGQGGFAQGWREFIADVAASAVGRCGQRTDECKAKCQSALGIRGKGARGGASCADAKISLKRMNSKC